MMNRLTATGPVPIVPARYWFLALGLVAIAAAILLWMGRPPICTCGVVKLWTGAVNSADNSQHIADWYTPSHIIHGFLFYLLGWAFLRSNPPGDRLLGAVLIEAGWELLENSPMIIDRYRQTTMALGYSGDSVLNSVADIGWMSLGFALARRLPLGVTILLAIGFELLTLAIIRDNLTLNVLMLVAPIDAIRIWQAGA
nr:DUF2585 domain-containing protein [Sphingomonas deserti]